MRSNLQPVARPAHRRGGGCCDARDAGVTVADVGAEMGFKFTRRRLGCFCVPKENSTVNKLFMVAELWSLPTDFS